MLQHAEDPQIDPVVVQPFGFAQDPFLDEAEFARQGAAPLIPRGAADFNAVQPVVAESFGHNGPAGAQHDAPALVFAVDPVADTGAAVPEVDLVQTDRAAQHSVLPDRGG